MTYHILDATCGSRSIWFQKDCPSAIFMDKRKEHYEATWKSQKAPSQRTIDVDPNVVGDFTDIPFNDNSFELVVFDPPHLTKINDTAWLKKKYGRLPEEWKPMIYDGFWECMRVLKPYGTLIFKWNEVEIPTREIIETIECEPLFGHRSGTKMQTHWLVFMKGICEEEQTRLL